MTVETRTRMARLGIVLLVSGLACVDPAEPPEATAASEPGVVELTPEAVTLAGIEIEMVRTLRRTDVEEAPGAVALDETHTARVGAVADGIVIRTTVEVGSRVRSGEVLAGIHSHVVHDSRAAYRTAIAEQRRWRTELAYAEQAEARARRLFEATAISDQQRLRAEADRTAAAEQLDMATTEVRRSMEELDHYGIDITGDEPAAAEEIPVRSPLSGIVLERLVTPGTAVTIGMPLFVVSDLSTLWAVAEIDETRLSRVAIGRPVQLRVAAYPDETFAGTITYISATINPRTRRVTVRAAIPNADGRLKPAMYATVALGESESHEILAVPADAVQEVEGQATVFVAEGTGRFRARAVQIGAELDDWVEVGTGLEAGTRVASSGTFLLKSELLKGSIEE